MGDGEPLHIPGHVAHEIDPRTFAAAGDPLGRRWIEDLPATLEATFRQWSLTPDGDRVFHGYNAVVLLVRRENGPAALKVRWPAEGAADEARALSTWDGRGMVRLLLWNRSLGALLVERLDPNRSLMTLDPYAAAAAAGRLLRRLAIPPVPGNRSARTLMGETGRTLAKRDERLGHPLPREWLLDAVRLSQHLSQHAGTRWLIHADLHHDNILAGQREPWLAIDPRPLVGEPEGMVPELLWTRDDYMRSDDDIRVMIATVVEAGQLNADRVREWVIVRCVDYLLWGLEHGLTHDPRRCRRILEAMV